MSKIGRPEHPEIGSLASQGCQTLGDGASASAAFWTDRLAQ